MRAQAALAQGIVDDADAVAEQLLAHLVAQEAGLARDRCAVGGARQMRHQRPGDARIEHHRHLARRHLARIEPLDRALAGGAADLLRRLQIGGVPHARIIVIALHAGAFAGDRGHRQAVAGAEIGAAKSGRGHQHHAADAGRGRSAARLGDALDRKPGGFGRARHGLELADRRQAGIDQVEIGKVMRQLRRVGEPGIFVLGRGARHRHRARSQRRAAVARRVVGRHHRLALSHQHAQAEIVAFGTLRFLHRAIAHLDRQRHGAHRHRVGGIGAGGERGLDQPLGAVGEGALVEQGGGGSMHDV